MNDAKVTNAVAITHINNAIQWLKFFKDMPNIYLPDRDRPFNNGLEELEKAKVELSKKCSQIDDSPINGIHYRSNGIPGATTADHETNGKHYRGNGIPGGTTADREIIKENKFR